MMVLRDQLLRHYLLTLVMVEIVVMLVVTHQVGRVVVVVPVDEALEG
mgnify:CR=1 FL=1